MKYATALTAMLGLFTAFILANGGLHSWKYDQVVDDVAYRRIRTEKTGDEPEVILSIGQLTRKTEIDGLNYEGWLHRRDNGTVRGGLVVTQTRVDGIQIPAGTWVSFDRKGRLRSCHFPANRTVQEFECRGTGGGSKGAVVKFYPGGRLQEFFAPRNIVIENVPCSGGLLSSIQLHENGQLKQCTLAAATTIDGMQLESGARISLDINGQLNNGRLKQ